LGPAIAQELSELPFSLLVDDLYVCHASPSHNAKSYWRPNDQQINDSVASTSARTLVAGHIHHQWKDERVGKNLILAGSVGLPLNGQPRPQYVILERARQEWTPEHRTVAYNQAAALKEYVESGAFTQGGPIGWMLYDELATAQPRLSFFQPRLQKTGLPARIDDWEHEAKAFLEEQGRWDAVAQALKRA
jgi:hypothetical protein